MAEPDSNVKQAFSRVKEDISSIKEKINFLEQQINTKNEETKRLFDRLETIDKKLQEIISSIGNEGVKRSIDQSINHKAFKQLSDQNFNDEFEDISLIKANKESSTGKEGVEQLSDQSIIKQSHNQAFKQLSDQSIGKALEEDLSILNEKINTLFFKMSKQELKLFLTIYQLEDEGISVTNKALGIKMQLSEPCIRSYLSSLLNKNAPISKVRVGSRTNLLSISKEFRVLNIKEKLISLYYNLDPNQKTLSHF